MNIVLFTIQIYNLNNWLNFTSSFLGTLAAALIAYFTAKMQINEEKENNKKILKEQLNCDIQIEVNRKINDCCFGLMDALYIEDCCIENFIKQYNVLMSNQNILKQPHSQKFNQLKQFLDKNFNRYIDVGFKNFYSDIDKLKRLRKLYTIFLSNNKSNIDEIINLVLMLGQVRISIKEIIENINATYEKGAINEEKLNELINLYNNKFVKLCNCIDKTIYQLNISIQEDLGSLLNKHNQLEIEEWEEIFEPIQYD